MKRIISLLLLTTVLVSMLSFASEANVEGWMCLGAKWSSKTGMILEDTDSKVKENGFVFSFIEDGSLLAEVPDYATMPGNYGTAVISGHAREALEGLSVVINPEDFDFSLDDNGIGNQISVLWTQRPITEIADPVNSQGLMSCDMIYNKGLRNIMPVGGKGLCITIGNTNEYNNEEGTMIASDLSIVYFDGEESDYLGNLGKEWKFTRVYKHDGGIMPLIEDPYGDIYPGYTGEYVNIDISYGLIIKIKPDEELGYIVNVNGKDYACEDDEIDLSGLESVDKGYITAGVVSNAKNNRDDTVSIKLSYINDMTAKYWSGNDNRPVVPCLHAYTKTVITEAECKSEGRNAYECILCGDRYSEIVPALGHSFTNYETVRGASCTEEGLKSALCDNGCGKRDSVVTPMSEHIPGDWEIAKEAAVGEEGERIKRCVDCGKLLESEILPAIERFMPDVPEHAWYYEGAKYCYEKGYIVGNDKGCFVPDGKLTREQFVTILARIAGAELDGYTETVFNDVKKGSWYEKALNWACENGITEGIGNGIFGIGKAITREELATMLFRYSKDETVYLDQLDSYDDWQSISIWARSSVNWAINTGILGSTSTEDEILSPKMVVTRAQASKIFMTFNEHH